MEQAVDAPPKGCPQLRGGMRQVHNAAMERVCTGKYVQVNIVWMIGINLVA
jgi:hypothetical protein